MLSADLGGLVRTLLHRPRQRKRSIAAATLSALAILGSLLVATPAQALNDTGTGGVFVPATGRFLDTGRNIGGFDTPMPAKGWRTVQVTGKNGVPDDGSVGAVSVVATAASISHQGILYGRPNAAAKTTLMGIYGGESEQNTSFSAVLAANPDGTIQVQAETSIRLILDVQGYYTASDDGTAAGGFVPLNGSRIADTRSGLGFPQQTIGAGERVDLQVSGRGGIPKGASGAIINMIAVNRTASVGYLTPYATGDTRPSNSFNYAGNVPTSMQAQVKLSADGKITIYNNNSTTDLVVDTQGYFTAAGKGGAVFTPGAGRAYDTRSSGNTVMGKNETRSIQIAGKAGVPVMGSGIKAVVLSLTSLKSTAGAGNATVWADGTTRPNTTSINFDETTIRTNTITVPLGANGKVAINSVADPTDYVFDVQGWYSNPQAPRLTCAAPFGAGTWTATTGSDDIAASCTVSAPAAVEAGQTVDVYLNDLPLESYSLNDTTTSSFTFTTPPLSGLVKLRAELSSSTGLAPSVAYEFGVGQWQNEALQPSLANGAVVNPEVVSLYPLPQSGLLPGDAAIAYELRDLTTGVTQATTTGNVPLGLYDLPRGHSYSWKAKVSAATAWDERGDIQTADWSFRVANEGEDVPDATDPEPTASGEMTTFAAPNGCSYSPDTWGKAKFRPACDAHDICYGNKKKINRLTCDVAFLGNLTYACNKAYPKGATRNSCAGVAGGYYTAVRGAGWAFYKGNGRNN